MTLIDPLSLVSTALNCPLNNIDENSSLGITASWDSFGYLQILLAMEEAYSIEINEDNVEKYKKMSEIIKLYQALKNE